MMPRRPVTRDPRPDAENAAYNLDVRLSFGSYVFDSRLRAVTRNGTAVELSPKAFLLLETLIELRPAPISKDVLYERLWPQTFVEPGNLHNLVAEIRRALDDREHRLVRTAHGVGYSFDGRAVDVLASPSRFLLWLGDEAVYLKCGETIVGRDPDATVVIDSPDVSRQHVRLFVTDDHVVVEDLGSKNGTFIDSEPIREPRVVRAAADIVIGKTRLLLRMRGDVKSTITAS
jgi:DNA-binding winged helix-turn-helix (wHTH) protein